MFRPICFDHQCSNKSILNLLLKRFVQVSLKFDSQFFTVELHLIQSRITNMIDHQTKKLKFSCTTVNIFNQCDSLQLVVRSHKYFLNQDRSQ